MSARSRGFSLIEVAISLTVLLFIMLVVSVAVNMNADQARFDLATSEAQVAARKILQQVARELGNGGGSEAVDYVDPTFAAGTASGGQAYVEFRERVALTGATSDWSEEIRYELQDSPGETAGNGVDDDRDGVVDERQLVRTQTGVPNVVLDQSVTLFRIDRAASSDLITITLEVARGVERKKVVTSNAEAVVVRLSTQVLLRNRTPS